MQASLLCALPVASDPIQFVLNYDHCHELALSELICYNVRAEFWQSRL